MEMQNFSEFTTRYAFPLINVGITLVIYFLVRIKVKSLSCLVMVSSVYSAFLVTSILSIYQHYVGTPDALILIAGGMLLLESLFLSVLFSATDFAIGRFSGNERLFGEEADFARIFRPLFFRKSSVPAERLGHSEIAMVISLWASIAFFLFAFFFFPGWVLTLIAMLTVVISSALYFWRLQ